MDITGPGLDRLGEDVVNQFDDRGITGIFQKIGRDFDIADNSAILFHVLNQLFGRTLAEIE